MNSKILLDNFNEELHSVYEDKSNNIYHYIPSPDEWPRFKSAIPGFSRGSNILVLAGSGVGKSKLVKKLIRNSLKQSSLHNIDLHILYNNIEESVSQIFARDYILEYNKITKTERNLTVFDLLGYTDLDAKSIIDPYLDEIKERVVKKYDGKVNFLRESNVQSYYTKIVKFLKQHGKFYNNKNQEVDPLKIKNFPNKFIPTNKRFIFVVVLDRILLMNSNKGNKTAQFIQSDLNNLFINLVCNGITITVQQQNDESSVAEYDRMGNVILDKIEPALINLKENRATKDPAHYVFGLFNPHRFPIKEHRGYMTDKMNEKLRSLHFLKSREGAAEGGVIHFGFDGALEEFYELPYPNSPNIDKFYKFFQNL